MPNHNEVILVEETEYAKDVIANLNPDFKKRITSFQMFEVSFRNYIEPFKLFAKSKEFSFEPSLIAADKTPGNIVYRIRFLVFYPLRKLIKVARLDNFIFKT